MAASTPPAKSPRAEPFPPLEPNLPAPSSVPPTTLPLPVGPSRPLSNPNKTLSANTSIFSNSSYQTTSPKLDISTHSTRTSPVALTGQAAMSAIKKRKQHQERNGDDIRQTSPNPAVETIQRLAGLGGISRSQDAPAPEKLSEPLRKAAEKINVSDITSRSDNSLQVSPTSMTSFGSLESAGPSTAMTSTADSTTTNGHRQYVAEPAQMGDGEAPFRRNNGLLQTSEDESQKAFSYPGPPPQQTAEESVTPSRGMSYPGLGQDSPASPPTSSNKRHKCPFCATDFTRHHNLKSHLLTHSQEKPYECKTCSARFRRLHDLKRHTKLHTGERPHTCDKCGRRFARGDALARHNKGPGGCAGRRTSFNGEDDYGPDGGGESMDGVEYQGRDDEDEKQESSVRRVSEPSRKRTHADTLDDSSRETYRQHSSTYPPAPIRAHASSSSSMGPPQVLHPATNATASIRDTPNHHGPGASQYYGGSNTSSGGPGGGQVFDQRSMIESPKPLSPGQPHDSHRLSVGDVSISSGRHRSPSLTTQFQQAHFGRGSGGRTPPQANMQFPSSAPVLPPLHHSNQHPPRVSLGSSTSSQPQQTSNPNSLPLHGRNPGSIHGLADGATGENIWNVVRQLEQRISRMQDEYELRILRLQEEVISLKGQVSAAAASQYATGPPTEPMSGVARY